jgi:polar amino acid transport system substrate-binding protein
MLRVATAVGSLALLASCASTPMITQQARSELAPTGKIRVALNYGNRNFARRDAAGQFSGVAVDLSRELGRRTGLEVELVGYPSAGQLTGATKSGDWDIAFLAYEQAREKEITFPAAFAEVDSTYLVPPGSPYKNASEMDRPGVRIAVGAKGGNDLFLTRTLKHAQLVRVASTPETNALKVFVADKLDGYATLRPTLIADASKLPGYRVLEGRYTVIPYSVGIVKGRDAGAAYLRDFIAEAKASGLLATLLEKNGVPGLSVPK